MSIKYPLAKCASFKCGAKRAVCYCGIQANAFVHHMVRNIVGSLIEVGAGNQPVEWMKWLLEQKDRKLAAPTAKPEGLYLVNVIYPEKFAIPQKNLGPLFLEDNLI